MEDLAKPEPADDEVLIKVSKTSICGTDIHLYQWDEVAKNNLPVPSVIGHEFVGHIAGMGRNVKGFKEGDRVSGEGHIVCGKCTQCRNGRSVLCPNTFNIAIHGKGCFAEYFCLPAQNAILVPDEIPDEVASIFDPLGNAVHTALSFDLVGKDVLITGAGPIGLMSISVAKKAGARHVVISDLNPFRLSLAKRMGATAAVNIKEQSIPDTMQALSIEGFDVCLEMSGNAQAFASLPELATYGGGIALLGFPPSRTQLEWHHVIFKMLTIKGIYGREIFRTWYQMIHLLQSGLEVTPVITHYFSALDYQKGFDAMLSGSCGKVILDWSQL
jgi:threonine 3-dehydrogenase